MSTRSQLYSPLRFRELADDRLGVLPGGRLAAKITGDGLALRNRLQSVSVSQSVNKSVLSQDVRQERPSQCGWHTR